jgi:hypothetical protein
MKTAVEWLEFEINRRGPKEDNPPQWLKELYEQAKEMELSQLVECWNTAHQAGRFEGKGIAEKDWQTFETYWEETFKSE